MHEKKFRECEIGKHDKLLGRMRLSDIDQPTGLMLIMRNEQVIKRFSEKFSE